MKPYEILDARIVRASGHGQYKIEVNFMIDGKINNLKIHSTDSELFDSENVLEDAKNTIEIAIEKLYHLQT